MAVKQLVFQVGFDLVPIYHTITWEVPDKTPPPKTPRNFMKGQLNPFSLQKKKVYKKGRIRR